MSFLTIFLADPLEKSPGGAHAICERQVKTKKLGLTEARYFTAKFHQLDQSSGMSLHIPTHQLAHKYLGNDVFIYSIETFVVLIIIIIK